MIGKEFYQYLSSDLDLQTLLNGSAGDKKIYPLEAPQPVEGEPELPHIVYSIGDIGDYEENHDEVRITVKITAKDFEDLEVISKRIKQMLDLMSDIQGAWKPNDYFIYFCKNNGGGDLPQVSRDNVTLPDKVRVMHFDVWYRAK
nr:hypothetical protein 20 [Elusimicrobiota bacterium]